ncbi:DNA-directed RNA polymerase I subunit 1 isoform X2 [Malania oleifera]|uniref:DNA-directed RNA polymerase I subunit 1 isoform X2 n=1 Tax=Malania oleifera TaxID=397392 RepID=UPI0025AEC15E|nr:DNA-directed RNA polymerase I subunit 1 isoform X2 [Malania oleifera]
MANTTEGATECVEAIRFSFYTDEEVKRMSFKKISDPNLLDDVQRPVLGGLYDPALGPLDELSSCKSCGQRSFHCPGHCGHIELVSTVYNPLLFDTLYSLLQKTCYFCGHFRSDAKQVEKCASRLELIIKGDIVGAKKLDSVSQDESPCPEDSDGSHASCSTVHSGAQYHSPEHFKPQEWTSLQFSEAMSVLNNFLKPKHKECKNCKARNPSISKPTFGWFHMNGMLGANTRGNIVRECKLEGPFTDGVEEKLSSDTDNVDDTFPKGEAIDTIETHSSTAAKRRERQAPVEFFKQQNFFSGSLLPSHVRVLMKKLWENEAMLCSFISDLQQARYGTYARKEGYSMFFLDTLLVPPIKFRPPSKGGDSVMEHPQTVLLGKVLQSNLSLANAHIKNLGHPAVIKQWRDLQQSINVLFDSKTAGQRDMASGICQLLEKKEGIFRQKMMGKRVNYACRSVISPDPYLAVNEIGIPPYFALRLTYPERVTPWNVSKLRDAIVNGPEIHPGATHYVDKMSKAKLSSNRKMRISISRKLPSSRGVVTQPGKNCNFEFEGKVVYRHLQDGDVVLVNRQPTLHKPSIMAHVVRVLKGEKTLRMHYANCSTYNADFDGDEMNVHFPQDEISRAEAYNIVNANNQYIIPTRGDASRALIQDHIVSAVLLTKKDTFLTREECCQLLYSSGVSTAGSGALSAKPGQKVSVVDYDVEMQLSLPAIWKPEPRWTGKQVITAVLNHVTRGHAPFTVKKDGKIPREYFGSETDEEKLHKEKKPGEYTLFIYKNNLVHGVIDKAQFGNYGLVHTVQELYGSNTAGILLSVLSRLFTVFLQLHGFTCGVDDLLILRDYETKREAELEDAENIGEEVHRQFIGLKDDKIDSMTLQMEIEKAIRSNGESAIKCLDRMMSSMLNEKTSNINKELLNKGLLRPFPRNCISLMTTTGAKGSTVNFSQISSFLGQQELEGKRVPRMISGKTLPCFLPWDCASRAGGFIRDRFLTGLRPQEYYFHCMAGREGLVDTAVKTSRSGYLQRCLVKNLECLKVCYDHTVRDADGSIVQFSYGEDGVDVHQTSFLAEFNAMAANQAIVREKFGLKHDGACKSEIDSNIDKLPFINSLSEKERKDFIDNLSKGKEKKLLNLVKHKYFASLAQPGEPVGVIAAQSVGEPSTQMTLNTFHLAGRGEVNVTLGIPRLQEILMTASSDIKTPIMTCPLLKDRTEDDGKRLAAKLKKVTVADIVESMEVCIMPVALHNRQISSIYKLKMKLYDPEFYPPYSDISLEDCENKLEVVFMRELEDAIQNHLSLLSRISGIKNFTSDSLSNSSNETDEEVSGNRAKGKGENDHDDDDDENDDEEADDIGLDAQKRKQQAADDIDYEDGSDEEPNEEGSSIGFEKEIDQTEVEVEIGEENEAGVSGVDAEASEMPSGHKTSSKTKSGEKKTESQAKEKKRSRRRLIKDSDRAIYVAAKGVHFEAHFRFTNEPHILLAQPATCEKNASLKGFGEDISELVFGLDEGFGNLL